jgi:drug/metabolite transporter (DMT)-like permease
VCERTDEDSNRYQKVYGLMPIRLIPTLFVLLWATGFIGARYAMPYAEPFYFLLIRFAIAGFMLAVFALVTRRQFPKGKTAIHAMITGALIHGAYLSAVFWAIHNGLPAGMSALIVGIQPILTTLLAGAVLKEKIYPRHWLGLVLGLAGVAMVLFPKLHLGAAGINSATIAASFVAVLCVSAGTIWQKKTGTTTDMVTGTTLQYAGACIVTAILSLTFEHQKFEPNGELYFALAWLVIVLSIGAIFLLMRLIRDGAVNSIASLFYLIPAVTAIMANVLFGEELHGIQYIGMVLVAAAVWVSNSQLGTLRRASA